VVSQLPHLELILLGRSAGKLEQLFAERPNTRLIATRYTSAKLPGILPGVESVIHLAARRLQPGQRLLADYLDNIQLTDNLLAVCAAAGITNVVLASTIGVYDPAHDRLPFRENQVVTPPNGYALSKLICEKLGPVHRLNLKALRLAQLVGWGERAGSMLSIFIDRARRGEPPTVWGQGRGERDYLYVKDAARAVVAAVDHPATAGVFNIGSGRKTSHRQLAAAVVTAFAPGRLKVRFDPRRAEDTAQLLMDSSLARCEFGWQARYSLAAALREMAGEGPPG